jgi:hypothetical protein
LIHKYESALQFAVYLQPYACDRSDRKDVTVELPKNAKRPLGRWVGITGFFPSAVPILNLPFTKLKRPTG